MMFLKLSILASLVNANHYVQMSGSNDTSTKTHLSNENNNDIKLRFKPLRVHNFLTNEQKNPIPVILWHGMGDNCCHSFSMGAIKKFIKNQIPNIYIHSLCLGKSIGDTSCDQVKDTETGFFGDSQQTINYACWRLQQDSDLMNAYTMAGNKINIVGFSQGGLFSRVLAQQCQAFNFNNVVSMGGVQNGIFGLPNCPENSSSYSLCEAMRKLLNLGAYWDWIQRRLIQAQYWHDSLDEETYKRKNIFLAKVNFENASDKSLKSTEVQKLNQLKNLVLVKFGEDEMVVPRESSWFGYYEPGSDVELKDFRELPVYKNLGLDQMEKDGKLTFLTCPGQHLQFTKEWFQVNVINVYLK